MSTKRIFVEPRVIAGGLAILFGFVLIAAYDSNEYALEDTLWTTSTEEYVRVSRENEEKKNQRDYHQISIAVCLGLGGLMLANGIWRARRNIEESALEQAAGRIKAEQLLDSLDDILDD